MQQIIQISTTSHNGLYDITSQVEAIVNPLQYTESNKRRDLSLEKGKDHEICEILRNIKLSSRPLLYQFSPSGESILFPGRNILDA